MFLVIIATNHVNEFTPRGRKLQKNMSLLAIGNIPASMREFTNVELSLSVPSP